LADAKQLMTESIVEVDKIQQLSDQLLQLSQYQTDSLHQVFSPLNLQELLQGAVKKITPISKKKKITLRLKVTECTLFGHQRSLSELFTILLDNAVKYSEPGTEVLIEAQPIDKTAHIMIQDHGVGIAAKDLRNIFDRFYRADVSRTRAGVGGYGLGLAIAKQIVTHHQGKITVQSQLGLGTTFLVSLPLQVSERSVFAG
jgi:signal transduction histidine kinase